MKYYSVIKRNKLLIHAKAMMNLKYIRLSERSQIPHHDPKLHMYVSICVKFQMRQNYVIVMKIRSVVTSGGIGWEGIETLGRTMEMF